MKKKRTKRLVFFALAGILVLFYMIGESYCEGLSGGSSLEEKNEVMCKYKYLSLIHIYGICSFPCWKEP